MLNSINLRDFLELNQTRSDYVGKFLNIRFHVRIIWIIHANQTIQRRKKCFMSALIVCFWPGRLLTPGLKYKPYHFKATPKNRRIRGYMDTQSHVSAYPIHVPSSFKDTASKWRGILLLLRHLSWVASHRALCSSLVFFSSGLSRLPVARHRTLILVKLLGIHSLLLSSIYNYKLTYLFGTCTPATGSPNERLSSEVIFLLRKESVLRCFGAHSCCQRTYLFRQKAAKS